MVYGRPALAVPVAQVRATVEITPSDIHGIWIEAPEIRLKAPLVELPHNHPLVITIRTFFSRVGVYQTPNLNIRIVSTIPVASGLGSGAAVSVALCRALASYLDRSVDDAAVNAFAYEMEKVYHGTPSGIDNTVITYSRPVYFVRGRPIETFKPRVPFTIVIGDTGVPAPTKESVADVHRLWENDRPRWEGIFTQVGRIVDEARHAIEFGRIKELGELMDQNHALLQQMTVSSPKLDELVQAARRAGALGAKLSGGGRGGNMIALVDPTTMTGALDLEACLRQAGAKRVISTRVR